MAGEPQLRFRRLDLFADPDERFDFVRAMNVLNLRGDGFGFDEDEAREGLRRLAARVREGGLLLVGRTEQQSSGHVHRATLWEVEDGDLRVVERFAGGSELEPLLGAPASVPGAPPGDSAEERSPEAP